MNNHNSSRTPTVGVLIIDNDKVLLVKHGEAAKHLTGAIGLPGGRIDAGEIPQQAAIRELEEETGIQVKQEDLKQLPHEYFGDLPRKDGSILHTHHKVFVATNFIGDLRESEETTPFWESIDTALSMHESKFVINTQDMIKRGVELIKK